jgi:uncharacterized protein (TIGR00255 family)
MTGYGIARCETPNGLINTEIRSVNNRFFELSLRIPDDLRGLEPFLRERLASVSPRGKFELRISILRTPEAQAGINLVDKDRLRDFMALASALEADYPGQWRPISVAELLTVPGLTNRPSEDSESFEAQARECFNAALETFLASRTQEGRQLAQVIQNKANQLELLVDQARQTLPRALAQQREKIQQRVQEAFATLTDYSNAINPGIGVIEERIRQEAHLAAGRADIAEELDRLEAHLQKVQLLLKDHGTEPKGKRLDFLCQELHREANTLGAKSIQIELTEISLEMKLLIEQIKEQVQNIQ